MNIIHYSKNGKFSEEILENAKDVVIAIDSQCISSHQVTLPKMSKSKAHKAIPFALESQLLDEIDDLNYTFLKSLTQNIWDVFVISKEILENIENQLFKVKCSPVAIVPDFMLLPFSEGNINYYEQDGFIKFRSATNQGGCLASKNFHALFADSNLIKADFSYSSDNKVNIQTSNSPKGVSGYLSAWRIPAAIALIALLLATSQIGVKNNQLNKLLLLQKNDNETRFLALFPEVDRVVNIRAQTKQKLSEAAEKNSNYQNDLLGKLSSEVMPNSKARKITFENQMLTLEVSK